MEQSQIVWKKLYVITRRIIHEQYNKIRIMSYASQPDKDYNYDGDYVDFEGKRYWVCLRTETVAFVGNLEMSK